MLYTCWDTLTLLLSFNDHRSTEIRHLKIHLADCRYEGAMFYEVEDECPRFSSGITLFAFVFVQDVF